MTTPQMPTADMVPGVTMEITNNSAGELSPDKVSHSPVDYWGYVGTSIRFGLPDGVQYIEFDRMNEGQKSKYQKLTSGSIEVKKSSGNAVMNVDPARDRHALIVTSVIGWNLYMNGNPVKFQRSLLENWLIVADPQIIGSLEAEIRKHNPWLKNEMTVAEIEVEIENLRVLRDEAEVREQGK